MTEKNWTAPSLLVMLRPSVFGFLSKMRLSAAIPQTGLGLRLSLRLMISWCCCFNLLPLEQPSAARTQARLTWSSGIILAWYLASNLFVYTFPSNRLVSKTSRLAWEKDSILNWNLQMDAYFYRSVAGFFAWKETPWWRAEEKGLDM